MYEGRDLPTPLFDPEVNRAVQEALPEVVIDFFAIFTTLGDGATLVGIAVLLYWFGTEENRYKRAMVLAIAVTTLSVVAGIKGILEVQRPLYAAEPALAMAPELYDGYSTPSAHSMGAAAVYGALAVVMDIGTRRQRYAVAGTLIVLIPASRVIIGVHYVGDVIIGTLLGLALVAVALQLTKRSITPMFALSLLIAVAAFLLGSTEFTTMAIGASAGGLLVWWYVEDLPARPTAGSILLLGVIVLGLLGVIRIVDLFVLIEGQILIASVGSITFGTIFSTVGYAIAFGGAIAVPFVADQLTDHPAAIALQRWLPFTGRTVDHEAINVEPQHDDAVDF